MNSLSLEFPCVNKAVVPTETSSAMSLVSLKTVLSEAREAQTVVADDHFFEGSKPLRWTSEDNIMFTAELTALGRGYVMSDRKSGA